MTRIIARLFRALGLARYRPEIIPVTSRQLTNFLYYAELYKRLKGLDGALVECGVGKGRSFLYLSHLAEHEGAQRALWGFDSFEGFPEPSAEDESTRKPKKGDWSDTSEALIRGVLAAAGISKQWISARVRLEKGYFEQSLERYDGKPIALLHLDGDLYESYKHPLEKLFPLVVDGGLILLDEYDDPKWPGAKRAVDEFFEGKPYRIERHESGKHFIVKH